MEEFKVNEYITLKLEDGITNIYIKGDDYPYLQCKYLLMRKTINEIKNLTENIKSIDEFAEHLDHSLDPSLETDEPDLIDIPHETEFWAHCSVRHESCMVECGNLRNNNMVSLSLNRHSRSRPRDGRVWLPKHAPLVMMVY
ncbi:MAG: hypothetical protein EU529_12230, partial [Promethearchaeota archaeon]